MEIEMDFLEPGTPIVSSDNGSFWRTEDSGYQTSFTPGSVECPKENLNLSYLRRNRRYLSQKYKKGNVLLSSSHSLSSSPIIRRGTKRPYEEESDSLNTSYSSVATPTSVIAGGIRKLKVDEGYKLDSAVSTCSGHSGRSVLSEINNYFLDEYGHTLSFPTTPIKKLCRSPCRLSPLNYNNGYKNVSHTNISLLRGSARKLNFTIHSLQCETQGLQPVIQQKSQQKPTINNSGFRPNQKIDIVKILYQEKNCLAVIMNIFKFLSNEDIYNFSLVSPTWLQVCEDVSKAKLKVEEHRKFLKENQENITKGFKPVNNSSNQVQGPKQIFSDTTNKLNNRTSIDIQKTPPVSPKTNKFKRFSKVALMDSREQLVCVRCSQPAKVTKEKSGEMWAECASSTCSYQFCKFCKCKRHPSKKCFQYDLDGPSPSKRKKETCSIGSRKSRKNLQRLLV